MFSPYTSHIPYRPILGNHDTLLGGLPSWEESSTLRAWKKILHSSPDYFQIVENNIHFFCMDLEWGNDTNSPAQYAWFKSEPAQVPAGSWIIVMAHAFWYSSGEYTDGAWWWDNAPMIQLLRPCSNNMVFKWSFQDIIIIWKHLWIMALIILSMVALVVYPIPPMIETVPEIFGNANNVFGYNEVNINGNSANVSFVSPEGFIYNSFTVNKTNNYGI